MCSVLAIVMFLNWAGFGGPDTCMASLPPITISSHFMLNNRMALSTFLDMIVARGLLLPAVESSLCVFVCVCMGGGGCLYVYVYNSHALLSIYIHR